VGRPERATRARKLFHVGDGDETEVPDKPASFELVEVVGLQITMRELVIGRQCGQR